MRRVVCCVSIYFDYVNGKHRHLVPGQAGNKFLSIQVIVMYKLSQTVLDIRKEVQWHSINTGQ